MCDSVFKVLTFIIFTFVNLHFLIMIHKFGFSVMNMQVKSNCRNFPLQLETQSHFSPAPQIFFLPLVAIITTADLFCYFVHHQSTKVGRGDPAGVDDDVHCSEAVARLNHHRLPATKRESFTLDGLPRDHLLLDAFRSLIDNILNRVAFGKSDYHRFVVCSRIM